MVPLLLDQRDGGGEVCVVDEVAGSEPGTLLLEWRGDLLEARILT
jgi:hypothetical protein